MNAAYARWRNEEEALAALRREHLDCGCVARVMRWRSHPCPECGRSFPLPVAWPTGTPVGEDLVMEIGCRCGCEYQVVGVVQR